MQREKYIKGLLENNYFTYYDKVIDMKIIHFIRKWYKWPLDYLSQKSRTQINLILMLLLGSFVLQSCGKTDEWKGSPTKEKDYIVITNEGKGLFEGKRHEKLKILKTIGAAAGEESDIFGYITWVDFDTAGNIYVLDKIDQVVTKLSPQGQVLLQFGGKGNGPGELAGCNMFTWAEGRLYFANAENGRIEVFDEQGGNLPAIKLSEVTRPEKIHFRKGCFYVGKHSISSEQFTLYKYDRNWNLIAALLKPSEINRPYDILRNINYTRIGDDAIWIVYFVDNKIRKIDLDGNLIFETSRKLNWDLPRESNGKIIPEYPIHRVCDVDPDGNLYVIYSNPENWKRANDVYKYGADGRLHGKAFTLPVDHATMVRFDREGNFYFSDGPTLFIAKIQVE
ncbi:MAG: hypothetical protein D6732_16095 [Methanobacteriota archaeon]|nr:MAG: hypothetical protein D6732_16095 [Euryarchaeota archaeon]